jgi:hypothetical protein
MEQDLMVSGSNDWTARLCDIRNMSSSTSHTLAKGMLLPGPIPGECIDLHDSLLGVYV